MNLQVKRWKQMMIEWSEKMNKNVNHPSHYQREGQPECIDVIENTMGTVGAIYFCLGNSMKYQYRAGLKENLCEDLLKASWYIEKATELINKLPPDMADILLRLTEEIKYYNPRIGDDDNE